MNRQQKLQFLRDRVSLDGQGLEIGPHVSPMFRKSQGDRVKFLEARSTGELRALMERAGRDPQIVEEIDFVLDRSLDLSGNVGGERFDWVASSHVLEHIPDFVGHLNEVTEVLTDGGVYAAIIPDRNLCFDCLKPASSLGEVLQAHMEKRQMPSIASTIDELRYGVRPNGIKVGGWTVPQAERKLFAKYPGWVKRVGVILAAGPVENRPDPYVGHSWRFDPVRFAEILADLCRLGLLGLELTELRPTYNMDFIAILRKVPKVDLDAMLEIGRNIAAEYEPPRYAPLAP